MNDIIAKVALPVFAFYLLIACNLVKNVHKPYDC